MHSVADWLAASPPRAVVRDEIERTRQKLALLELIDGLLDHTGPDPTDQARGEGSSRTNGHHASAMTSQAMLEIRDEATNGGGKTALSQFLTEERERIVRAMLTHRNRVGSPHTVADTLRSSGIEIEDKPVQTTMSRMVKAGQLVRLRKGAYRVPDHIAALVQGGPAGINGEG